MRLKLLLSACWRHHRVASIVTIASVLALLVVPFAFCNGADPSVVARDSERSHLVLDRVWFDRYPDEPRTQISVWLWLSSGVGLYQQGSSYRASFDIFEFARNGRDLEMTFLHDDEEARSGFAVEPCDQEPPFDLCLTLEGAARGPARYYSFSDQNAAGRELPEWVRRVDAQARAAAR